MRFYVLIFLGLVSLGHAAAHARQPAAAQQTAPAADPATQDVRAAAAAFLEELATLSPGDLVVHADHGIGRYEGLTQIPVSKVPHDCVALEYARGNKLYVPVENIEILSRFGSETTGVALD